MANSVFSIFTQFIQQPTGDDYRRLHGLVTAQPGYDGHSDELSEVQKLIEAEDFARAGERVRLAMGRWLLSPVAHMLASFIASKRGDMRASNVEGLMTQACFTGILATGDGSSERPYLVSRVRDEYEILNHLGKTSARQAVIGSGDLFLDCHTCNDGSEVCFDITVLKRLLDARFKKK